MLGTTGGAAGALASTGNRMIGIFHGNSSGGRIVVRQVQMKGLLAGIGGDEAGLQFFDRSGNALIGEGFGGVLMPFAFFSKVVAAAAASGRDLVPSAVKAAAPADTAAVLQPRGQGDVPFLFPDEDAAAEPAGGSLGSLERAFAQDSFAFLPPVSSGAIPVLGIADSVI